MQMMTPYRLIVEMPSESVGGGKRVWPDARRRAVDVELLVEFVAFARTADHWTVV